MGKQIVSTARTTYDYAIKHPDQVAAVAKGARLLLKK
jgi:hypothetical protein